MERGEGHAASAHTPPEMGRGLKVAGPLNDDSDRKFLLLVG